MRRKVFSRINLLIEICHSKLLTSLKHRRLITNTHLILHMMRSQRLKPKPTISQPSHHINANENHRDRSHPKWSTIGVSSEKEVQG